MDQVSILSISTSLFSNDSFSLEPGDSDATLPSDNDPNQDIVENVEMDSPSPLEDITASAKSQVLENSDLLEAIFTFFHPPKTGSNIPSPIPFPVSQYLLWASLTSKMFLDPAMRILWRSMDSWLPLLRLIPALRREGNIYTLEGPIHEQNFERLERYGRHMWRLDLPVEPSTHLVSPYIYTYIQLHHSHLLPNVRELIIPDIGRIAAENLPGLFLTLSPSIYELSLGGIVPAAEGITGSLLQSVRTKAESLRRLACAGQLTAGSLNIMYQFSKLETLRIDGRATDFPQEALERFSELASLKSLSVGLDDTSNWIPPSTKVPSFEALHNLEISASAIRTLSLLQNIAARYLKRIQVHFTSLEQDAPQDTLGKCIQSIILMTKTTKTLKTLIITSGNDFLRVPAEELVQLKAETEIAYLDIALGLVLPQMMNRLLSGGSWRSIETLILRSGPTDNEKAFVITVSAFLQYYLVFLPNIKYMAISVILRFGKPQIDGFRRAVQRQAVCHNLQDLVFLPFTTNNHVDPNDLTVENAFVLARCINHFCPHLRNLDMSKLTYINAEWRKGVEVLVKGLQEATNSVHVC
ncbi:hypothetical protein GALMADRAFT_139216 [Galerina marginata CBS 339.88]|uniref:F-box domain-containing protein n=1 Tax=Galerina marginata (strain CBS 339.88) TaxID=685588 RepID=A0A067TBC2_GALM3|nr:hypothetical protein GALMADRAFT_139216 [Galerina marginata CBS 339.88]